MIARPLIDAINQYSSETGSPPESPAELDAAFLSEVPSTQIEAYPEYEYYFGEGAKVFEGNAWALVVSTPSGGISFDISFYIPQQNYPERGYGGVIERVRDWAYVHE